MKNFVLVLFVLVYSFGFSQDKLFLKNGEIKTGKVKEINKTVVRFIPTGFKKRTRYTSKDIEKVIIVIKGKEVEFVYEKVPYLGTFLLGELISVKISLYVVEKHVATTTTKFGGDWVTGGQRKLYYCKRQGEDDFFELNTDGLFSNKFKNRASKYFKDCPSLANKIKSKELTTFEVVEICELYNK